MAETVLRKLKRSEVEVGLVWVNDRQIRRLNRMYRGIDLSTDVLSFSVDMSRSFKGPDKPPVFWGDVVISLETAFRQANEISEGLKKGGACPWHGHHCQVHSLWRNHGFYEHIGELIIHGILHLQGFDHETEGDTRRMKRKERELAKEVSGYLR